MRDGDFRVVHYVPTWLPQTQTWLFNQLKFLPPDFENHVVCRSVRHLDQFEVPHIHCLKRDSAFEYMTHRLAFLSGSRGGFAYFGKQLQAIGPKVVHSHFGNNGWTVREAVRHAGLPHFVTWYGQDVSRLPKSKPVWRDRYQDLFADERTFFLCEGGAMARALAGLGCPPDKIRVHHLGVEVERIAFEPRVWLPGEPLRVLIASGFREKKGIPFALEALGRLRERVNLEVTVIGDAEPTPASRLEKQKILDAVDRFGLSGGTRFLGFQSYKVFREALYRNHIFMATSVTAADGDTEGGAPVALVDVAASGMPVVSSVHCDIPEIVVSGRTGWLAEERNVDDIFACLLRWVDDSSGWGHMLAAGRLHMEMHYDAVVQGRRLGDFYREAVA